MYYGPNRYRQSFPLKNRLAGFILETAENRVYGEPHTEAAEYLGATYRHLLYVIAEFYKEGLLHKSEVGYRITDADTLRKYLP